MRSVSFKAIMVALLFTTACSSNNDDDNPGPGPGGNNDPVTITGMSPEFVFWGEQLTINGTGFSGIKEDNFVWLAGDNDCGTNQQDSTDWKKAEVVSASATKLIIKVPYTTKSELPCGADWASVRVTVKGKKTMVSPDLAKLMGFPNPLIFCDNYGGAYHGDKAMRPGDSVLLTYSGGGMINLHNGGQQNKIRLAIGTTVIPVKLRPGVTGCGTWGLTFLLPNLDFAAAQCTPINNIWGIAGEMRPIKLFIEGVSQAQITKNYFVGNLPRGVFSSVSGPIVVIKSAGGNPQWTVKGKNMTYGKVRFSAAAPCTGYSDMSTVCNSFCDEFSFVIPLSVLNAGCTYSVNLIDVCGGSKNIGSVKVNP